MGHFAKKLPYSQRQRWVGEAVRECVSEQFGHVV